MLGLTDHYDDLEDLTAEKRNDNMALRTQACWKVSWRLSGKLTVFKKIFALVQFTTFIVAQLYVAGLASCFAYAHKSLFNLCCRVLMCCAS